MKNIISLLFREDKWITHASQQTMASSHVFGMGGVRKSFCLFHRSSLVPIHQCHLCYLLRAEVATMKLVFFRSCCCMCYGFCINIYVLWKHGGCFFTTISLRKYLDFEPEPLMLGRSKQHRWSLSLATCLKIEFLHGNKSTKASLYRCYVMVCYIYIYIIL